MIAFFILETPTKSGSNSRMSPTLGGSAGVATDQFGDRQFVVLTSEKQARVVALPSHNCVYRQQITDGEGFVVKAEIISLKGIFLSRFVLFFSLYFLRAESDDINCEFQLYR